MKILTQNLKNGKTDILEVPSPSNNSTKIKVLNHCSLISTGTESYIVDFGKAGWINKARQQPDRVKDVLNKIWSSGISQTYKAIRTKLNYPMPMGYSAVGVVSNANQKYNLPKGTRIFTNSFHQEEALIDYNMCVKIPDNVDDKSASFGAIGGIAMQSIKCIPKDSKTIAIIGLGLLGQITSRILLALGYKCITFDIDSSKVEIAKKNGAIGIESDDITEEILNHTNGNGVDCTIIAASSLSSDIVNHATSYTKRKGKIVSSGLVGLNLVRENFFQKQIEFVVSNSSGDKNHRGNGSSYENINYFFELISSDKVKVLDLISEEVSLENPKDIYSFPKNSLFFSKLINYETKNINQFQTFSETIKNKTGKLRVGLIGSGNFAMSTFIHTINSSKDAYLSSLLGREGLPLYVAKKRFSIDKITTNELDFYKNIDVICIATPHQTHFNFLKKATELSLPIWIEKPLVISEEELIEAKNKMLSNQLVYSIGHNRSQAPWTISMRKKINSNKAKISMNINAGKLPSNHWLLDKGVCGGRILGECCHFVDLALTLLSHTELLTVECIKRDIYYQDTGSYILKFKDGSICNLKYRHDLSPRIPKEKITVQTEKSTYINNNWKSFNSGSALNFSFISKGKGHHEAINSFFQKIKSNKFTSEKEIHDMCFSTYVSIKLQKMFKGDILDITDSYNNEIISKSSKLNDRSI